MTEMDDSVTDENVDPESDGIVGQVPILRALPPDPVREAAERTLLQRLVLARLQEVVDEQEALTKGLMRVGETKVGEGPDEVPLGTVQKKRGATTATVDNYALFQEWVFVHRPGDVEVIPLAVTRGQVEVGARQVARARMLLIDGVETSDAPDADDVEVTDLDRAYAEAALGTVVLGRRVMKASERNFLKAVKDGVGVVSAVDGKAWKTLPGVSVKTAEPGFAVTVEKKDPRTRAYVDSLLSGTGLLPAIGSSGD